MNKLKLHKKIVVAEETITKEVEEIIQDKEIKEFGKGGAYVSLPVKHKGKKAIIGVYKK